MIKLKIILIAAVGCHFKFPIFFIQIRHQIYMINVNA